MKTLLNTGWQYRSEVTGDEWQDAIIPHTPRIEAYDVGFPFQGISYYKRELEYLPEYDGKLLYLEFEAVMQVAEVIVNGKKLCIHKGGYLPFRVNITDYVSKSQINIIEVVADNSDNSNVPPGKSAKMLDFAYYGGIYRNVWLDVADKLHITDSVEQAKVKGGGIYVSYGDVSEELAKVYVKVNAENMYADAKNCSVRVMITDRSGNAVAYGCHPLNVAPCTDGDMEFKFEIENPHLWSCENPYLYKLETELELDGRIVDSRRIRIGIRTVSASLKGGLRLNGKPITLRGANRHQTYPHIGNALHDNAQRRDAVKYKNGGFNFVRFAHYPQANAFLDACDELGILVMEPTPGWQWCAEGEFKENVYQNIRDMIRRDRNHPCVIIWETSLNETGDLEETMWHEKWEGCTDEFARRCRMIAEMEFDRGNFLTAGDAVGRHDSSSIGYDIAFTGLTAAGTITGNNNAARLERAGKFTVADKPSLRREYGDFGFGKHYSTSRQTRDAHEKVLLLQAWNYMWSHNNHLLNDYYTTGNAIWCGADYTRGYFPGMNLATCGALDSFRLPKFVYHFFASQQSEKPYLYIANYYNDPHNKKLVVFSNCDEVELFVNGRSVRRQKPDNGATTPYMAKGAVHPYMYESEPEYAEAHCDMGVAKKCHNEEAIEKIKEMYDSDVFFDGGNCEAMAHPPFTFSDVPYEEGVLEAVGYIGGTEAVRDKRRSPHAACALRIETDEFPVDFESGGDAFFF